MNIALALKDFLDDQQLMAMCEIVRGMEFLPISCLLCRGDEHRVISKGRAIPDDFIYFLVKGKLECGVGGERRVISPGEFLMVPAGLAHEAVMAQGSRDYEVYALHMHLYDRSRHRFFGKLNSPFGAVGDLASWTSRLAACTCLMGRSPDTGGKFMEGLVGSLLVEQLLRGHNLKELAGKTDQRIARLLARIRRQPAENWTVRAMAEHCFLSVSRFRQLFVACTKTSPKKYVQKVRLSLARSLLATEPSLTVEEVADRVGVSDVHYFHAIYRQQFGETPKQRFRRSDQQ